MKWHWSILLIIIFALIGFFIGRYWPKPAEQHLIISSQPSKEQKLLSDSIIKLNYRLSIKNKSLIKVIRFKPTMQNIDTVKTIVESIKEDTAKISYLQASLLKSLGAYVVCQNLAGAQDSLVKVLLKSIGVKDSAYNDLAVKNIKLKERNKIL